MTTTTTTTTTTLPLRPYSLNRVETIVCTDGSNFIVGSNGSSSKGTIKTINATSLSFGPLAPGEISETKIVALRVPYAKTIDKIKISLVDTGGITFSNNIFGVEFRSYVDYNLKPSMYFQGLNEDNDANNVNNVSINNRDKISSQYVYLNVSLPSSQNVGIGVIRFKWFFDWV